MRRLLAAVLIVGVGVSVAAAAVLHVEQDGSGDYVLIQDAVNAAADGDTILIGPGQYDDLQPRGVNSVVCVAYWEDSRNLAFIGENADSVTIGPATYTPSGTGPQGIHQHEPADLRVESLSFRNLAAGVVAGRGKLYVLNSTFTTGDDGLFVQYPDSCIVAGCAFFDYDTSSLEVFSANYVEVADCEFTRAPIYLGSTSNGVIRRCVVDAGSFLVCADAGGSIEDCDIHCDDIGRSCLDFENCQAIDLGGNTIQGGGVNMTMVGPSTVISASNNAFLSPMSIYANFNVDSGATFIAHNNDIRAGFNASYIVSASQYLEGSTATIDMGNNYWFENSNAAALDSLIYDGNDDPNIHVIVNYEPIRTESVPVEGESRGGLKALSLGR